MFTRIKYCLFFATSILFASSQNEAIVDDGHRPASINLGETSSENDKINPNVKASVRPGNKLLSIAVDQDPNRGTMVTFLFSDIAGYEVVSGRDSSGLTIAFPGTSMKGAFDPISIGGLGKLSISGSGSHAHMSYENGLQPQRQIIPDGDKLVLIFPAVVKLSSNGIPVPYQHTFRPHQPPKINEPSAPQIKLSFWRTSQHISLNLEGAYLRDVLKLFREASGHPIVFNDWLYERVTIELENVPWEDALSSILRLNGYQLENQGKIYRVTPLSDIVLDPSATMCY